MAEIIEKPQHYYRAPRQEMLPYIPASARRILEIGCGEGGFSAELKRSRAAQGIEMEVMGVELMADRAAIAATRLDRVFAANIERDKLDLQTQSYDCIVCNDVLEHLVSPWDTLRSLATFLKPGGHIVASIPNVRFWGVVKGLVFDGDWRYEGEGVLDATHLRFFTRRSIRRLFEELGFSVISLDGINVRVSGWKFELVRAASAGRLNDMKYWQFAVVAKWPGA